MRYLWLVFGLLCTGLAFIGVVTPLLPTVPFLLLAAFAFARSSPRLALWLDNHKSFGPMIRDWRERGAINRRAKYMSVLVIFATFTLSIVLDVRPLILAVQAVVLAAVSLFILTRPD